MSFFVPKEQPEVATETVRIKEGGKLIIFLGLCTIAIAVAFEQILSLPAFLGMMMGLSILMMAAWHIRRKGQAKDFVVLGLLATAEWDTLLFFFGVIFSVSGLAFLGYLSIASTMQYFSNLITFRLPVLSLGQNRMQGKHDRQ